MEFTKTLNPITNGIQINFKKGENIRTVYISGDNSNCKLSYIHQMGTLEKYSEEEIKEVIKILFTSTHVKGAVIINTISKRIATILKENFQVYYYQEVPIGYNNGYQYHICLRNHILTNSSCKIPKKFIDEKLNKDNLKEKLKVLYKKKKRKADIIDDILALI